MSGFEVTDDDRAAWAPFLDTGEELIWTGRPTQSLYVLSWQDYFVLPFFIILLIVFIFIIILEIISRTQQYELFDYLFFSIWCIGALYVIYGRFIISRKFRMGTIYALTQQRLIILRNSINPIVRYRTLSGVGGFWMKGKKLKYIAPDGVSRFFIFENPLKDDIGNFVLVGVENADEVFCRIRTVHNSALQAAALGRHA